jgi:hypothetical protein
MKALQLIAEGQSYDDASDAVGVPVDQVKMWATEVAVLEPVAGDDLPERLLETIRSAAPRFVGDAMKTCSTIAKQMNVMEGAEMGRAAKAVRDIIETVKTVYELVGGQVDDGAAAGGGMEVNINLPGTNLPTPQALIDIAGAPDEDINAPDMDDGLSDTDALWDKAQERLRNIEGAGEAALASIGVEEVPKSARDE